MSVPCVVMNRWLKELTKEQEAGRRGTWGEGGLNCYLRRDETVLRRLDL